METEPTNREILEAINTFASSVDQKFDAVDQRLASLESNVGWLKTAAVTKDYLDEKLAKFKDGLKNSAVRVGRQVSRLVKELHKGGILTTQQVLEIRAE